MNNLFFKKNNIYDLKNKRIIFDKKIDNHIKNFLVCNLKRDVNIKCKNTIYEMWVENEPIN